jgi:micrococcal nuclease
MRTLIIILLITMDLASAPKPYHYKAELVRVVDCDTIDVNLDLGFDIELKNRRLRLLGIDAFETRRNSRAKKQALAEGKSLEEIVAHGKAGTEWLKNYLVGKDLIVHTVEKDAFGRWLATVYVADTNLNLKLITEGYAKEYNED